MTSGERESESLTHLGPGLRRNAARGAGQFHEAAGACFGAANRDARQPARRNRAADRGSGRLVEHDLTGARADRRELNRMLGRLAPGDVVTVTRIDRLARSTFDLRSFRGRSLWLRRHVRA
jgi:hypothetical protein